MVCDLCGKPVARVRRMVRTYGKGERLLVIQNVPVVTCAACGRSYLTAETLHAIALIKSHRRHVATKRSVAVADFA